MSYKEGMAAINLEMPDRVPRTEYSAATHWELVSKVTGIDVNENSEKELQQKASKEFMKAWDYDFIWSILIHNQIFGDKRTKMGHAEYAAGGTDYDTDIKKLFEDPVKALNFDPIEAYGIPEEKELVQKFEKHYQQNCNFYEDAVNMTGIYVTLMSGLIEIFGWDMLLECAGRDPEKFGQLTNRYAEMMQPYFEALAQTEAPVVMVHDDIVWTSGPFISPDWYREYIFPNYKKYFAPLIKQGKKIMYTSDGDYTAFVDDIAEAGVDGFVLEPLTDMEYIAENYGQTHVIIGNADTRVLLQGTKEDIRAEVKRCMDIGKECPGYFMAVGNHIPANTPVESALYYNKVYREMSTRN
ncbi:MAG: uroporphyrinogen decarboxylase family protein [Halanaerobiaceae bacterium]